MSVGRRRDTHATILILTNCQDSFAVLENDRKGITVGGFLLLRSFCRPQGRVDMKTKTGALISNFKDKFRSSVFVWFELPHSINVALTVFSDFCWILVALTVFSDFCWILVVLTVFSDFCWILV